MRSDPSLDLVRVLHSPAGRRRHRLVAVEGVRFVHAAFDAGLLERLIVSPILLRSPAGQRLVHHRRREGMPVERVSPERFRELSTAARASGLLALARMPSQALPDQVTGPWVVVRRIRANGNLGTLIRSAEAFDAQGLIVLGRSVDPWSPDVVRASMGGVFGVRIAQASLSELRSWAAQHDVSLLAAEPTGVLALGLDPLPPRVAFILGDERTGLTPDDQRACDGSVRIPIPGRADSLNVAQAGTVLLYEAMRQRSAGPKP